METREYYENEIEQCSKELEHILLQIETLKIKANTLNDIIDHNLFKIGEMESEDNGEDCKV